VTVCPVAPRIFSTEYYARLHAIEESHWYVWGMRRIAFALLQAHGFAGTGRALDAGCGTGGTLRWLRAEFPALQVVGLDVALEALRYVRASPGPAGVRALRGSATALPFRAAVFDLVISLDVLQHLPEEADEVAALREGARVLRPGGLLLVRAAAVRSGDLIGTRWADGYHRYTLEALVRAIRAVGLVVRQATPVNWLLSRLEDLRTRRRGSHPLHHDPGLVISPPRHPWLTVGQRLVMRGEARYLAGDRDRRLPGGHTLILVAERPVEPT
jgi:ubiquinone/menaquinone biosynthesis C-methylase UbiE